ncbi:hypothetical protein LPJ62_003402, partial [Coemansia sp. RSA 2167]
SCSAQTCAAARALLAKLSATPTRLVLNARAATAPRQRSSGSSGQCSSAYARHSAPSAAWDASTAMWRAATSRRASAAVTLVWRVAAPVRLSLRLWCRSLMILLRAVPSLRSKSRTTRLLLRRLMARLRMRRARMTRRTASPRRRTTRCPLELVERHLELLRVCCRQLHWQLPSAAALS